MVDQTLVSRMPQTSCPTERRRHSVFCSALLVLIGFAPPAIAQDADEALGKRMASLESAVHSLQREIRELSAMLRSALPPGPVVDVSNIEVAIAKAPTQGNPDTRVALIEFSDFECPYCGRHYHGAYREILREFVQTGKVRYVFKHLPIAQLHPAALKAAEAAECAQEQARFWEFHDQLFSNQKALKVPDLVASARRLGLDVKLFEKCLTDSDTAQKVSDDLAEANRLGLTGTPAFLIGEVDERGSVRVVKRINGAQPLNVFVGALQPILDSAASR